MAGICAASQHPKGGAMKRFDPLERVGRALAVLLLLAVPAWADEPAYGPELQGFAYPFPVQHAAFQSQGEALQMAYMDVPPTVPANGRTAVLLHGKNFCAATWDSTIRALTAVGWRVVAPDQVGFCASSKPAHYQYSFQQLADNTRGLLRRLGIERATIIGHSTGGMLGIRYALMHPEEVEQLVLVDPIGLEDWKVLGVPSIGVDGWYKRELATDADRIRDYERSTYYAGTWAPEYERWVQMLAGLNRGPGKALVAWNSALIYDMIYTQPVVYEFARLRPSVVLMIGDKDNTAIGKDLAPPDLRARMGDYPALGRRAVQRMPHARLVEFPGLGHAPQIQAPEVFHKALLEELSR